MRLLGLLALVCAVSAGAETPKGDQLCTGPDNIRECHKFSALTTARLHVCAKPNEKSRECGAITEQWLDALDGWRKVMAEGPPQTPRPQAQQ